MPLLRVAVPAQSYQVVELHVMEITTVADVCRSVLEKLGLSETEAPVYAPLCTLLEARAGKYAIPLYAGVRVADYVGSHRPLLFRAIYWPVESSTRPAGRTASPSVPLESLAPAFREILYEQALHLVRTRAWQVNEQFALALGALALRAEVGADVGEARCLEYLRESACRIMPSSLVQNYTMAALHAGVMRVICGAAEQGLAGGREAAVLDYLRACSTSVKQFGCPSYAVRVVTLNGKPTDTRGYLCVTYDSLLFLNEDLTDNGLYTFESIRTLSPPISKGMDRLGLSAVVLGRVEEMVVETDGCESILRMVDVMKRVRVHPALFLGQARREAPGREEPETLEQDRS